VQSRNFANVSGAVVELSNYLEQRISSKSEEFAKVNNCSDLMCIGFLWFIITRLAGFLECIVYLLQDRS
jgi:hypothetical protein